MLTLLTSGTTKQPKNVTHSWEYIGKCVQSSIKEIQLTSSDIVLDVFPGNTIAHYTVTAMPAHYAGAKLISTAFNPFSYFQTFDAHRPTYIALIPRHWEVLKNTKEWNNVDMSCVRYMVVGSGNIPQEMIDDFRNRGVKLVANWYGMTEMPPPVLIGYNSVQFDINPKQDYTVEFSDDGECIIDGFNTGDIFDTTNRTFLKRKLDSNGTTWKNNF